MVEYQKEKYGWEFLFPGANIDAATEAEHFGIKRDRAVDYHAGRAGTAVNYRALSKAVSNVRNCDISEMDDALAGWDDDILADYKSRK